MKKVLITGGAGYLGSTLTEVLLSNRYAVTVLDNLSYKQLSLTSFCHNENFELVVGDVRDTKLLTSLVETHDIIIPLAAIVGMPACKANPELTKSRVGTNIPMVLLSIKLLQVLCEMHDYQGHLTNASCKLGHQVCLRLSFDNTKP